MNMIWGKVFVYFLTFNYVLGYEISVPFTAINSLLAGHTNCRFFECCGPSWIYFNETGNIEHFLITLTIFII